MLKRKLRDEFPCILTCMVSALVSLTAYRSENRPYNTVLTLEIIDRKSSIPALVIDLLSFLSGMAIDLLLPEFPVLEFNIIK